MKSQKIIKIFFLLSLFIIMINSCEGPMGPSGYDGQDGKDGTNGFSNWDVYETTIHSDEWTKNNSSDSSASYFYYTLKDTKLTSFIADSGLVTVYCKYQDSNNNWVYSPLPITRYFKNDTTSWSETFDYEYAAGKIMFAMTRSNSNITKLPSGPDYFKVVYNW